MIIVLTSYVIFEKKCRITGGARLRGRVANHSRRLKGDDYVDFHKYVPITSDNRLV